MPEVSALRTCLVRPLLTFFGLAILLLPSCAMSRSRVYNVSNKAVDNTAKATAVSGVVAVGAGWLVFESWLDDVLGLDDDDDFFEDSAYRTNQAAERPVRYQ